MLKVEEYKSIKGIYMQNLPINVLVQKIQGIPMEEHKQKTESFEKFKKYKWEYKETCEKVKNMCENAHVKNKK